MAIAGPAFASHLAMCGCDSADAPATAAAAITTKREKGAVTDFPRRSVYPDASGEKSLFLPAHHLDQVIDGGEHPLARAALLRAHRVSAVPRERRRALDLVGGGERRRAAHLALHAEGSRHLV